MTSRILLLAAVFLASVSVSLSQTVSSSPGTKVETAVQPPYRSTPAYAEVLLRRAETTATLESLVLQYTEEYPKVRELRHVLSLIDRESDRLSKVKTSEQSKLTLALGKLIVRKIELETDLWNLQKDYKDEHPDVKRAKRRVEIYETAIAEILN